MQKLMERIDRQDELLLSLQPSGKAPNPIERIRMFDNQDLCMLLQISKRTLLCSGEHKNPSGTDWGNAFQTPGCATCGEPCRSGAKLRP